MPAIQQGLLPQEFTIEQRFNRWKATPGGAQIMRMAYREAAPFARRHQRTGQRVSMDYLFHRLRDRLGKIRNFLARRGIALPPEGGYGLNDHFTAYLARHIEAHRADWAGMFEKRTCGKIKPVERTTIIRERSIKPTMETNRNERRI